MTTPEADQDLAEISGLMINDHVDFIPSIRGIELVWPRSSKQRPTCPLPVEGETLMSYGIVYDMQALRLPAVLSATTRTCSWPVNCTATTTAGPGTTRNAPATGMPSPSDRNRVMRTSWNGLRIVRRRHGALRPAPHRAESISAAGERPSPRPRGRLTSLPSVARRFGPGSGSRPNRSPTAGPRHGKRLQGEGAQDRKPLCRRGLRPSASIFASRRTGAQVPAPRPEPVVQCQSQRPWRGLTP